METIQSTDIFKQLSLFTLAVYYKNRPGKPTPEHSYRQETKFIQWGKPGLQINHQYAFNRLKEITVAKRGLYISAIMYDNYSGMQLFKAVGSEAIEYSAIVKFKALTDGSVVLSSITGHDRTGKLIENTYYPRPEMIEHMRRNWEWKQQYVKQQEVAERYKHFSKSKFQNIST